MVISLTKHLDKPATLRCVRSDGTVTWQGYGNQGGFFPVHDLTHYALETELGYRHAFFGMIAAGREIDDFGPGDAATFHPEAMYAEVLAGLLPMGLTFSDIKSTIDEKTESIGLEEMPLSEQQFDAIQARVFELVEQWCAVPAGRTLELIFYDS